jgi:HSP20 family molecular chaperone IbpA
MELHFGMFSRYMRLWAPIKEKEARIENRNGLFKIILKKKKKNK